MKGASATLEVSILLLQRSATGSAIGEMSGRLWPGSENFKGMVKCWWLWWTQQALGCVSMYLGAHPPRWRVPEVLPAGWPLDRRRPGPDVHPPFLLLAHRVIHAIRGCPAIRKLVFISGRPHAEDMETFLQ